MLNDLKLLDTMSAMTRHAAQRHAVIAENIANADTPGYTAKDITPFQDIYKKALQDNSAVPMDTVKVISAPNELSMSPNGNSVSNADTHGYQRKLITFENELDRISRTQALSVGDVTLDTREGELLFEPNHPLADDEGYVRMSNVDMMIELSDAREAGRSYDANLSTFKQATQMYSSLLSLLRR